VVKGKVVNISDYGAFVELEKGVEGLIHISEMSWTQHIKHPSKILAVGEIVEAKILNVDEEEKKISLGLKQLEPDPWDTLEEKYPIGSRHEGKVRNLTNFGAFVELEEGIDGLIHISDLSWTKKVRHPGEVVKKSDTIEVVVLNVDRENRRISLGYKQTTENPWDNFEEIYKPGAITKGKIVRLIEKGVIAELPEVVDGFVPMSHLVKPNITKPSDGYKVGDELELCVIEFNKDAKKIVLSEKIDHALSLVRQKEQGKEVEIEEPEELFAEPTEDMKIGKQPLAEAEKEDKVEQVAKDEKTTEEAKSEISAEEIKVEASAEEAKHEVSAEEIKVEASAEETKPEISAEETKVKAPAEEAKHEVSSEAVKAEFKTEEIEPKSDAKQIMDESTNEETKAGKIEGEEKADPVVEASATETESEQASVEKDKSSEATKKKTTKRRASTKKKEENTGDAK
jgi:small subunit ribosomal protein S1